MTGARRSSKISPSPTGGTVISTDIGITLADAGLELLGSVRRAVVTKDNTTLADGAGTSDVDRRACRTAQARDREQRLRLDREKLQERLAKLAGGIAVIRVGAATETALKERKHRVEDAVAAAKAAVEEGIIPGGGSAIVQAAKVLDELADTLPNDEAPGVQVVATGTNAPLHWIATNATDGYRRLQGRRRRERTWLQRRHPDLRRPAADGIIDPVKVTRSAVVNAASVARMVLTTETAITDKPAPAADAHAHHGHAH